MSERYTFSVQRYNDDCASHSEVTETFETVRLDDIVEKFFWFLRAAGFTYVDEVRAGNRSFSLK
jgi:hypothetical protein